MGEHELPQLSAVQLEIMHIVWEHGESTVNAVWSIINTRRKIARNTVQTLMTRLSEKGWLVTHKRGREFVYRPTTERGSTQRRLVRNLVDTAFSGSVKGLVMTLIDDDLTADELSMIRQVIEQHEKENRR